MIKLPPGIIVKEVPLEQRYAGVVKGLLTRIKVLYQAIHDKYGDEGLQLIHDVSEKYGAEIAASTRRDSDPWEIEKVGLFLIKVFNNVRSEGEVVDFTPERISIKVPCCPYPLESVKLCKAHTTMEESLVRGLNPDLSYYIEKSIPAGDEYCLHVLAKSKK